MRELVVDASVVIKWFKSAGERHHAEARQLRDEFEAGMLHIVAPRLLTLELLNAAGRRWGWSGDRLTHMASTLERIGFDYREPDLGEVARWVDRGLTAYDGAYAALASAADLRLVTDDRQLARIASNVSQPLGS
jgi:predicted nucleic acid-binding protein